MGEVSARYARALFATAERKGSGSEARYGELLASLATSILSPGTPRAFLLSPLWTKKKRKEFLASVFDSPEDGQFLAFLEILVDKDRLALIGQIRDDYRHLLLESRRELEAVIETAFPLDADTVGRIREAFKAKTGAKEIIATVRTVPELLGGVRVRIGSKIYDGTTRSELDRLYETMRK